MIRTIPYFILFDDFCSSDAPNTILKASLLWFSSNALQLFHFFCSGDSTCRACSMAHLLDDQEHENPFEPLDGPLELAASKVYGWICQCCKAQALSQHFLSFEQDESPYKIYRDFDNTLWVSCCRCSHRFHYLCLKDPPSVVYLKVENYICEQCVDLPSILH